MNDLSAQ